MSTPPPATAKSKPISVAVVEDDNGIREMLVRVVKKARSLRFLGEFSDAESALQGLPALAPDVVIMDIRLPNRSGIECTRALKKVLPDTQVVVFTVFADSDQVMSALKAGASGYLLKRSSPEEIVEAIHQVWEGGAPMSAGIARKVVDSLREPVGGGSDNPEMETLTPREAEILDLLGRGYVTKEIAEMLGIGFTTVRYHIRHIYSKLHVRSRAEVVLKYVK